MADADNCHLVVRSLFADKSGAIHQKGERITDPELISHAREHMRHHVIVVASTGDVEIVEDAPAEKKAEQPPQTNSASGGGAIFPS